VDGLPLALELAAVRMKTLSPSDLAQHLGHRLNVLNRGSQNLPRRHQALRETITWSHNLLTSDQQATFAGFSVFVGGANLDSVAAVLFDGDQLAALDAMTDLLDQSLLVRVDEAAGNVRFQMLETIREFAAEQLATSGNHESIAQRHADHFLMIAEEGENALIEPDQVAWMKRLEADYGNLRAAISCHLNREDAERSQRMSSALWRFWAASGRLREARELLNSALTLDPDAINPLRARALIRGGNASLDIGQIECAKDLYIQAERQYALSNDQVGRARANMGLGNVLRNLGEYEQAVSVIQAAIDVWQANRQTHELGIAHLAIAIANMGAGDLEGSRGSLTMATSLTKTHTQLAYIRYWNGWLNILEENYSDAKASFQEAVILFKESADQVGEGMALCGISGAVMFSQGWNRKAHDCLERSLLIRDEIGDVSGVIESLEFFAIGCHIAQPDVRTTALTLADNWRNENQVALLPGIQPRLDETRNGLKLILEQGGHQGGPVRLPIEKVLQMVYAELSYSRRAVIVD
ncbi:MAG TPA: hypothetical protein VEW66_02870, partial [Thermomicrobiales bacterium]|nr:hypothetical protein [Thermomicrobiales bacterium]